MTTLAPSVSADLIWNRFLHLETDPIPFIDIFHAIYNARDFLKVGESQPPLQQFVGYILSCLGGTMMVAIMLGQPIGWLCSDKTFGTYVAVFIIAFSPWTKKYFIALTNAPVISTIISAMDDLSWGNSVSTLGVMKAINPVHADSPFKTSVFSSLICGISAGCGGGLLRNMLNFNSRTWSFQTPKHFTEFHWPIRFSTFLAVVYYIIRDPHGYIGTHWCTVNEAKWVLIILAVTFNTVWNTIGLTELMSYSKIAPESPRPTRAVKKVDTPTTASPRKKAAAVVKEVESEPEEQEPVSRPRRTVRRNSSSRK